MDTKLFLCYVHKGCRPPQSRMRGLTCRTRATSLYIVSQHPRPHLPHPRRAQCTGAAALPRPKRTRTSPRALYHSNKCPKSCEISAWYLCGSRTSNGRCCIFPLALSSFFCFLQRTLTLGYSTQVIVCSTGGDEASIRTRGYLLCYSTRLMRVRA